MKTSDAAAHIAALREAGLDVTALEEQVADHAIREGMRRLTERGWTEDYVSPDSIFMILPLSTVHGEHQVAASLTHSQGMLAPAVTNTVVMIEGKRIPVKAATDAEGDDSALLTTGIYERIRADLREAGLPEPVLEREICYYFHYKHGLPPGTFRTYLVTEEEFEARVHETVSHYWRERENELTARLSDPSPGEIQVGLMWKGEHLLCQLEPEAPWVRVPPGTEDMVVNAYRAYLDRHVAAVEARLAVRGDVQHDGK